MNRTCIIVPVYNHTAHLRLLINYFQQLDLPVYFVNDGSNDACSQLMRNLVAGRTRVILVEREVNGGKGAAIKSGLLTAQRDGYSHALQIDADGQHEVDDIPLFLERSAANPGALISGLPSFEDIPRLRYYGRYLTHIWVWINTWSLDIKDSMCGFRIYPVAESCQLIESSHIGDRMDFDTEIMVRLYWAGVPVLHVPTSVSYPDNGVSHFRGVRDNVLISWAHTRLFFGMLKRIPMLLARKRRGHG